MLNKPISKYDVAMILHANKLARLQESRTKMDHYVDGINYMAFAAQFASDTASVGVAVEDDIKAMAARLSPEIRVSGYDPNLGSITIPVKTESEQ